jgi:uncharacterized protein with GYD domain
MSELCSRFPFGIPVEKGDNHADIHCHTELDRSRYPLSQGGPQAYQAARERAKKFGVEIKQVFLTSGESDLLVIMETANGDNIAKFALMSGADGNVRSRTVRAWPEAENGQIDFRASLEIGKGLQASQKKRVRIRPTDARLVGGLSARKRASDSLKPSGAHLATKARYAPIGDRTRIRLWGERPLPPSVAPRRA